MQRDPRAFLVDVVEAADAIQDAVREISLDQYQTNRLVRSADEREFIIIAEALTNLSRLNPDLFSKVSQAPRIISFRNKITHEYTKVDNALVWGVMYTHLEPLRADCVELLSHSEAPES